MLLEVLETKVADDETRYALEKEVEYVDYNKIYDDLLKHFDAAYLRSRTLHLTEKVQRQTLYHYKRRVNALVDYLRLFDDGTHDVLDTETMPVDKTRIENLILFDPSLKDVLTPVVQMADETDPAEIQVGQSYGVDLVVDELIPELPDDELDNAEMNPQEVELWARRNFSHLVVSKFKPADIKARGVREDSEVSSILPKRKKKKD